MTSSATQALLQEGVQLHMRGALDEAARRYERVLQSDPGRLDVLEMMATLLIQQSRLAEALAYVEKARTLEPENPSPHHLAGVVHMGRDRPAEALTAFERAVALQPTFARAWLNHALAALRLRDFDTALASLDQVIALHPDNAAAHLHRAQTLIELGRRAEALAPLERALTLKPDLAEAELVLGNLLLDLGRPADALAHHQRAAAAMPQRAEAYLGLANTLQKLSRSDAAIAHYQHALALSPDSFDAPLNLAIVHLKLERPADALPHLERALALKPDSALALEHLGNAQRLLGRTDDALASYDRAIAADPVYANAYDTKGKYLIELGRLDEAYELISKAIALDPGNIGYLQTVARLKDITTGDPHFAALEALAREADALAPEAQLELHFALGKAYADDKQYARSFHHMRQANALKRREFTYDEAATLRDFDVCREVFTPELLRGKSGGGDPSTLPVFIVGMPRSGSTLIEQILASHPQVHGAGERHDFENALKRAAAAHRQRYPAVAAELTEEELRAIGAEYVSSMRQSSPGADRIVDKMLGNFLYLGLIRLALPNARIIHARRDPIDTCVSCFSLRFVGNMPFLYDLGELGRYYRAYETLMAHWREVLPTGVMLEVQYEDVVDDVERQARGIVAHCGLEWNDACLAFHESKRPVRTASAAQVRRPIYRSSVERWRHYEDRLQPLFEALGRPQD